MKEYEMSPRERQLNMGDINTYITGSSDIHTKVLPGFTKHTQTGF